MKNAFSLEKVQEWDAIGITRGIHVSCKEEFKQHGSGLHICRPDGSWKTDLSCTIKECYQDTRNRVLENGPNILTKNGEIYCRSKCKGTIGGFKYIGLQNGNECFCGTQIRFSPMSLPPNECNRQCSGNAMETCGGYWKIEIYPI